MLINRWIKIQFLTRGHRNGKAGIPIYLDLNMVEYIHLPTIWMGDRLSVVPYVFSLVSHQVMLGYLGLVTQWVWFCVLYSLIWCFCCLVSVFPASSVLYCLLISVLGFVCMPSLCLVLSLFRVSVSGSRCCAMFPVLLWRSMSYVNVSGFASLVSLALIAPVCISPVFHFVSPSLPVFLDAVVLHVPPRSVSLCSDLLFSL